MSHTLASFFEGMGPITGALLGGIFCWFMSALGASSVIFFKTMNRKFFDIMLGFTGGIMLAASFFSLLLPAIEMSHGQYFYKVLPSAIGFSLGALFLYFLDKLIPHVHVNKDFGNSEGIKTDLHGTKLLVLAITLHNIPEGLAIGVLFGGALLDTPATSLASAIALTIGIAIQDFPEGIAVALPVRREGFSRLKSFHYGQLSAVVEPIAAVFGAILVSQVTAILPYALAFAAGAMIFVTVEEVIPEFTEGQYTDVSTLGFLLGFLIMMVLDVGLG